MRWSLLPPSSRDTPPSGSPPSAPPSAPSSRARGGVPTAASITATGNLTSLVRALQRAHATIHNPAGLLLFGTGSLGENPEGILAAVRNVLGPVPTTFSVGSGVRTEEGEHEGGSAVAGILFRNGRARTVGLERDATPASPLGGELAAQVRAGGAAPSALILFGQGEFLPSQALADLGGHLPRVALFGAGTPASSVWRLGPDGEIERGPVAGMAFYGGSVPIVRASTACKLITPLAPVTAVQGTVVLSIAGRPALSTLSSGARALHGQPLVLCVIARSSSGDPTAVTSADEIIVRGIRGVDPSRGGIVVSDEVEPGMLMGFGVLDPSSSKQQLDRMLRETSRKLAGAAPQFGLMLSCYGRGKSFYPAPQVEIGLFRERFPHVPVAGALSPFEIAPFGEFATVHLYTTVVALFAAPS